MLPPEAKVRSTETSVQNTPWERREDQILEDKSVKSSGQWQETKPKEQRPGLTLEKRVGQRQQHSYEARAWGSGGAGTPE